MKELRLLGSTIKKLSQEKHLRLESFMGWTEDQTAAILDGRLFPSFADLQKLSKLFSVTVDDLMHGDEEYYNQKVVHCMGLFEKPENREMILDIIDDYLVLMDAVP